jgi:hypothetical protein
MYWQSGFLASLLPCQYFGWLCPIGICTGCLDLFYSCSAPSVSNGRSPGGAEDSSASFEWRSPDEAVTRPFEGDLAAAVSVASEYDLCLSGDALHHLHQQGLDTIYVPLTQVRCSRAYSLAP